jgi:hypothetical protein
LAKVSEYDELYDDNYSDDSFGNEEDLLQAAIDFAQSDAAGPDTTNNFTASFGGASSGITAHANGNLWQTGGIDAQARQPGFDFSAVTNAQEFHPTAYVPATASAQTSTTVSVTNKNAHTNPAAASSMSGLAALLPPGAVVTDSRLGLGTSSTGYAGATRTGLGSTQTAGGYASNSTGSGKQSASSGYGNASNGAETSSTWSKVAGNNSNSKPTQQTKATASSSSSMFAHLLPAGAQMR